MPPKRRHDEVTGALLEEPPRPAGSATGFERYLSSPEHATHPYGYLPQIHLLVASLGHGKSTAIYGILNELIEITNPKHLGRILYYTGSKSDRLLEQYDPDTVEIFDPNSKESFMGEIRTLLNDASDRADRRMRSKSAKARPTRSSMGEAESESSSEDDDETPPHHVVVLEDCCQDKDLMPVNLKTDSIVQRLMMSTRHVPCTIIVSAQKMNMVPSFCRSNASHIYLFSCHSEAEKRDCLKVVNFSKGEAEAALSSITERGQFIWLDNSNRRIYKNFTTSLCR